MPLYAGFISQFIVDDLPLQRLCYNDVIFRSPTNNDVVRKTIVRTLKIASEKNQEFAVVTYDLAIASKAYAIQALKEPRFGKLLILLGNFHMELAFFGAVGTFLNGSGIETVLAESGVLAEGSLIGFMKGKFYNRCQRIHELVALVLERLLFQRFMSFLSRKEQDLLLEFATTAPTASANSDKIWFFCLENKEFIALCNKYNEFFDNALNGKIGKTAQYWTIYIFFINRIYRDLQQCVRTSDVSGYNSNRSIFCANSTKLCALWHSVFASASKCWH